MLRDLEEILLRVDDLTLRAYLGESVRCYGAGAFRASVVIACAAGMDGLRGKLNELASSGGASAQISQAAQQIQQLFQSQQSYENQLIDQCELVTGMLTPAEASKLKVVLKTRHLCAHPSGHASSPEEARDAIATVVDLILSRPTALGMVGVTDLLARLAGPNFFPIRTDDNAVTNVVREELRRLNPKLITALSSRLTADLIQASEQWAAANNIFLDKPDFVQNGTSLLAGMLRLGGDARTSVWTYLGRLVEQPAAYEEACTLLSVDPDGLAGAEPLTRSRAIGATRRTLDSSVSRICIMQWFKKGILDATETNDIVASATVHFLSSTPDDTRLTQLAELGIPSLLVAALAKLVQESGSPSFNVANTAISMVQSLTPEKWQMVSPEQQLTYVLNVANSAGGLYPAYCARDLLPTGLGHRTSAIDAFVQFATQQPDLIRERVRDWKSLAQLCAASARTDVLPMIVGLLGPPRAADTRALEALDYLVQQPATAAIAAPLRATTRAAFGLP